MQNCRNDAGAVLPDNASLKLRVYTSRLLWREEDFVLHGEGNNFVKNNIRTVINQKDDIICVKVSNCTRRPSNRPFSRLCTWS